MTRKVYVGPECVPIKTVALVFNGNYRRALRWVRKNNCAVKIGGRYFLTKEKLLACFPGLGLGHGDPEDYTG